ncbi:long-chain acyl-CoA synthetase [Schistosoma bovis]|uniref:long-chain-fatty-acid--CoA ligase n=1 Tax=Schistosoma bovis TaxID=6184 RepID=A0A430QCE2_SCHBO|nr:long-chain acyl-CoA synthetase [Schistosoma bovis]
MFCDSVEVAQRISTFAPDTLQHIILFPNSSTDAKSASVSSVNSLVKIYDYEEFLEFSTGELICTEIFNNTASHLSYLPLAHIMEQMISLSTLLVGARIGFLTKNIQGLLADLQAVKPHFFFTVPRVLSRLYSVAMEKVSSVPLLPSIFHYAVESKVAEQEKRTLGGRVKVIVSGSAPVASEILRFTRGVFGCPVIVGYGLSESCGVITLTLFGDKTLDHVGALIPGVSAKLVDVPHMGISVDKMKMGEICVKGLNCTQGYYRDEESTKQLIDKDGWLHTGDIGSWTKEGSLKIVDRCKNIFKLSQGEYIAPERLENIYQLSPLIEQIFVDGNSLNDFPVAVVVPNIKELTKRIVAKANLNDPLLLNGNKEETEVSKYNFNDSIPIVDTSTLCSQPAARKIVVSELENLGRKRGLKGFEIVRFLKQFFSEIKRVHLSSFPFTVENGLLTSNLKLVRSRLRETFSDKLHLLYEEACS